MRTTRATPMAERAMRTTGATPMAERAVLFPVAELGHRHRLFQVIAWSLMRLTHMAVAVGFDEWGINR